MDGISLSLQDLLNDSEYGLGLSLLAGERGLTHRVSSSRIQKPGLALAGYTEHLHPSRKRSQSCLRCIFISTTEHYDMSSKYLVSPVCVS